MIALLAALALSTAGAPTVSAEPAVGSTAPDFSLPDHDGKTWTLSEQKGTTVVVFYPRAFTGG